MVDMKTPTTNDIHATTLRSLSTAVSIAIQEQSFDDVAVYVASNLDPIAEAMGVTPELLAQSLERAQSEAAPRIATLVHILTLSAEDRGAFVAAHESEVTAAFGHKPVDIGAKAPAEWVAKYVSERITLVRGRFCDLLALQIKHSMRKVRGAKKLVRCADAQIAADAFAQLVTVDGSRCDFPVGAFLDSCLSGAADAFLAFSLRNSFEVAFSCSTLSRLKALRAILKRKPVFGWVDSRGLHIRWNNGGDRRGGLDLLPQRMDRWAPRSTVLVGFESASQAAE